MSGTFTLDSAWLATVLLLSLRLAATFLLTPLLAAASVPFTVRVLLVFALAAALTLALPPAAVSSAAGGALAGGGALLRAGFTELALGATLALGILLAFAAFSMAGQLLGVQIGFGLGQVIDPTSSASVPLLASAFSQLAVLTFFLVDGHHALLRGVAYSLERFPLGEPWPLQVAVAPLLRQVAGLFALGFALAAPVAFCLLLVEMALGVVARQLPQMNMLTMGIPIKVVVGVLALALWVGGAGPTLSRVYGSIYRSWDALFLADEGAR